MLLSSLHPRTHTSSSTIHHPPSTILLYPLSSTSPHSLSSHSLQSIPSTHPPRSPLSGHIQRSPLLAARVPVYVPGYRRNASVGTYTFILFYSLILLHFSINFSVPQISHTVRQVKKRASIGTCIFFFFFSLLFYAFCAVCVPRSTCIIKVNTSIDTKPVYNKITFTFFLYFSSRLLTQYLTQLSSFQTLLHTIIKISHLRSLCVSLFYIYLTPRTTYII